MIRPRKILVPVDFSPDSLIALDYAIAFGRASDAQLSILHVTDPRDSAEAFRDFTSAGHLMKLLKRDERLKGIRHVTIENKGNFMRVVKAHLSKKRYDLIVMGTRGANTLRRKFVGTNTTNVIRKSGCPVLVVPEHSKYKQVKKIMVATDLSDDNLEMVNEAVSLFQPFNPELDFLYIDLKSKEKAQSIYRMKEVAPKIGEFVDYANVKYYISTYRKFHPGVDAFYKKTKADMLLMVTHKRNMTEALLKPSLTRRMAFHTTLPMLAIPVK